MSDEAGETTSGTFQRFRDPFPTNRQTSGQQVETCKRTPSQRYRQQTGTAKGGMVIGLQAQLSLIRLIYWRKSISPNLTPNRENRDAGR